MGSSRKVFNSVFESALKMAKTAYLFFLDSSNFSLEREHFLSKFGQKNSGCFLKTAKYVRRRTIWYFFQRKCFFISLFWAGNFKIISNSRREISRFFIFRIQWTFWFFFFQRNRLFMDCGLKYPSFGRKFSSVFSKVPSRCEREHSCFFWLLYFFLLEPENNLSKIGQKTRHFSQRSKILVQKNKLPSFPWENAFHFSTLGKISFRL